jgi:5-methyltetrahydrofolate--homocysteine methyltransferase
MDMNRIVTAVQKGQADETVKLIGEALSEGIKAQRILDDGLVKGMSELGEKFSNNQIFVPEVLMAAEALEIGTDALKDKLIEEGAKAVGKVVILTVAGDLHDIGKNLVRMMFEGAGFEVIDLGVDISCEQAIDAVKEHSPDILALSALLTTTMQQQAKVIQALKDNDIRNRVKVMVGGAAITEDFANNIGADAYSRDAVSAVGIAKNLIGLC